MLCLGKLTARFLFVSVKKSVSVGLLIVVGLGMSTFCLADGNKNDFRLRTPCRYHNVELDCQRRKRARYIDFRLHFSQSDVDFYQAVSTDVRATYDAHVTTGL